MDISPIPQPEIDHAEAYGAAPYAVAVISPEGRYLYINSRFEQLTDYSLEVLKEADPGFLYSPLNAPEPVAEFLQTTLSRGLWTGRLLMRRRDGIDLWIDQTMQLLRDADENPSMIVCWMKESVGPQQPNEQLFSALLEASSLVTQKMDIDLLLQKMTLILRHGMGFDRAGIWRLEGDSLRGTWGTLKDGTLSDERSLRMPLNDEGCILVQAVKYRKPCYFHLLYQVSLPIMINGQSIGAFAVDNGITYRPIDPDLIRPLSLCADYIGIALRNAHLQEEIQAATSRSERQAVQLRSLLLISQDLAQEWVQERLFREIARRALDLLDARAVDLFLNEGDHLRYVSGARLIKETGIVHDQVMEEPITPIESNPLVKKCIQMEKTMVVEGFDDPKLQQEEVEWSRTMHVHARIAVPFPAFGGQRGALIVTEDRYPRSFSEEEVRLASSLACSAAVVIRNSQHISEIERLNRELQHSLEVERDLAEVRMRSAHLEGVLQTVRTVNHEINNPLQALMGSVELLQSRPDFDLAKRRLLNRILTSSQRIADVSLLLSQVVRASTLPSPVGERIDLLRSTERSP